MTARQSIDTFQRAELLGKLTDDSTDVLFVLCHDNEIWSLLSLPDTVPVDDLQNLMCELDPAIMAEEWEDWIALYTSQDQFALVS